MFWFLLELSLGLIRLILRIASGKRSLALSTAWVSHRFFLRKTLFIFVLR